MEDIAKRDADSLVLNEDNASAATISKAQRLIALQQEAKLYCASGLIPDCFKGKERDVAILMESAQNHGIDPLAFIQNSYVVHGQVGLETKAAIAMARNAKVCKGPIRVRFEGKTLDDFKAFASCIDAEDGQEVVEELTWHTVRSNGWDKNPSWVSDRQNMMHYRVVYRLIRHNYPEVLLGLYSTDEIRDSYAVSQRSNARITLEAPNSASPASEILDASVVALEPKKAKTRKPAAKKEQPKATEPKPSPKVDPSWKVSLENELATCLTPEDAELKRPVYQELSDGAADAIIDAFIADISDLNSGELFQEGK